MPPSVVDPDRVSAASSGRLLERASTYGGPLVLAGLFLVLARWTWGTWPDVLIDFGRELYVPWRLSQGAILYRDVAWFNGPLSPHLNATVFRALGASLTSLVYVNLALLAVLTGLLWSLLRSLADAFAATLACAVLLTVFGFGQLVGIGNYNFVCPYSHEVTHGVFFSVTAFAALLRARRRGGWWWSALAGFSLGLVFLTKAEVFLAAAAGVGVSFWLLQRAAQGDATAQRRMRWAFGLGAGFPVLVAFLVLASELPLGTATLGTLGTWPLVLSSGAGDQAFYRLSMGLDAPLTRLGELAAWSGRWLLVFAPAMAAAYLLPRGSALVPPAVVALPILVAGLVRVAPAAHWLQAARPLPLVALVVVTLLGRRVVRDVRARELESTPALELGFALFALVLLAKMALNARVYHYGFALAMPATLLAVTALVGWLPAWLDERGRAGHVLRAVGLAALAVFACQHLAITKFMIERKTVVVGTGADRFRADARGALLNRALGDYQSVVEPGSTLAVLPEGVMVNWLLRSHNPTPFINFMPPEFLLFGEDRIVESFERAPPDYVMLIHKDTSEYGLPFFGPDYGTRLATWVQERYEPVRLYGDPPLLPGSRFGIRVLRRR